MRCAERCSSPGSAARSCSASWRTWWTARSPATRAKRWHESSRFPCSRGCLFSPARRYGTTSPDASGARDESFRIPHSALRIMKFLCVECDRQMLFEERQLPGDGTLAAAFRCPQCGRAVGLLTNPMETQLVASLGVKIGGTTIDPQPLETVRGMVATGRNDAFAEGTGDGGRGASVAWTVEAQERLARVPNFVRGMVKKIYADYAKDRGIAEITPAVMDSARNELGLEGM